MEGSPENGERGARRTGVVIGVLATLVLALGIVLAVVLASGDDGGPDDPDVTAMAAPTQPTVTVTQPSPPTATPTAPAGRTIDQALAKAAAARGAAAEAARGGIGIAPQEWDVRCTAAGGGVEASSWTCQVTANGGQCQGTIVAYARAPGVAATREPRIACGE